MTIGALSFCMFKFIVHTNIHTGYHVGAGSMLQLVLMTGQWRLCPIWYSGLLQIV